MDRAPSAGTTAGFRFEDASMSETIGRPDPDFDLSDGFKPHTSHWGVFSARLKDGDLEVKPYPGDPDPNGIIGNFPSALRHRARVAQPMIRRGWLERGAGPDDRRGRDDYVPVSLAFKCFARILARTNAICLQSSRNP